MIEQKTRVERTVETALERPPPAAVLPQRRPRLVELPLASIAGQVVPVRLRREKLRSHFRVGCVGTEKLLNSIDQRVLTEIDNHIVARGLHAVGTDGKNVGDWPARLVLVSGLAVCGGEFVERAGRRQSPPSGRADVGTAQHFVFRLPVSPGVGIMDATALLAAFHEERDRHALGNVEHVLVDAPARRRSRRLALPCKLRMKRSSNDSSKFCLMPRKVGLSR